MLQPLFLTYSAQMQSPFGPNRRKLENTQYLAKFLVDDIYTNLDRMDPPFGPNRSNWEQCTILLFLGGFLGFFGFIFEFLYIGELRKLSRIILDIVWLFSRERREEIFIFLQEREKEQRRS
jgi:hypothetical protein